jgi:hypothetical protein
MKGQDGQIVFEAKIRYSGDIEKFQKVGETLAGLPLEWSVPGWPLHHEIAGCWPIGLHDLIDKGWLNKLLEGSPRFKVPELICRNICGGIRVAHVHLPPSEIVLVDPKRFKELVGRVATELVQRLGDTPQYAGVTAAMRELAGASKPRRE